jgi:hypothetical protein
MSVEALPLELVLEVVHNLDLSDSIHLLSVRPSLLSSSSLERLTLDSHLTGQTCSAFRKLESMRDFWIKALYRITYIHNQPLPCSARVDISQLPLATLRGMAQQAHQLNKRWSSQTIIPLSVRTLSVDSGVEQICAIAGTSLILILSDQRLSCIDTDSGECLASLFHSTARGPHIEGCPFALQDQCIIAFACTYPRYTWTLFIKADIHTLTVGLWSSLPFGFTSALERKPQ